MKHKSHILVHEVSPDPPPVEPVPAPVPAPGPVVNNIQSGIELLRREIASLKLVNNLPTAAVMKINDIIHIAASLAHDDAQATLVNPPVIQPV